MPQNIHIKLSVFRCFLGVRYSFGTHLLPVFYSGSIDLMIQNLFIIMFSRLVRTKRRMPIIKKLKIRIMLISVVVVEYIMTKMMNPYYYIKSNDNLRSSLQRSLITILRFSKGNPSLNSLPIPIHSPPDNM